MNYGEMYWADGSLYKGNWAKGLQEGLGILKFPDGLVTAGFFKENIYTTPLLTMEEFTGYKEANPSFKCTPGFEEEIRKYLEAIKPAEEYEPYKGKELVKAEVEDRTRISALLTMQEVPNAPFGPNGISKEDYIKQLQDSNENLFDREPSKVEKTEDTKSLHTKSQLIFHDFDYLNPESNLPFGVDGFSTAQQFMTQTSKSKFKKSGKKSKKLLPNIRKIDKSRRSTNSGPLLKMRSSGSRSKS